MLYSTIVDKNEASLNMIIEAAEKFDQGRYLNAIYDCHMKKEEILGVTEFVNEYKSKLCREHLALAKFALTFNKEFATDNNECFNLAEKLFRKIRSTISSSKKIYKKFCPQVRKRHSGDTEPRPSVFKRSELINNYHSEQLFGMEPYDQCVYELFVQLDNFFKELIKCLALCHMIIQEESAIRRTPERCMTIFKDCYAKMLDNSRLMVRTFKENKIEPSSEMEESEKHVGSAHDFVCSSYHMYNPSQFQMYVVKSELKKGYGMSHEETLLFGADNKDLVDKVRIVIKHFDELEDNAHKGKHKDKHSAYCVASFMLWCGIGTTPDDKVTFFVEDYFNKQYHGAYPEVKTNAVNNAKNKIMYKPQESSLDSEAFHRKIDALVLKYAEKGNEYATNVANF